MVKAPSTTWFNRVAGAVSVGFGGLITITSVLGAALGVQAGNGWLAILYGCLGVTMGAAGIVGVRGKGPLRSALFGWFLVGLACRAILEGDLYLWFVSVPIAAALLAALVFELLPRPSAVGTLWAAAGGGLAIISLVALAYAAPSLPTICPSGPKTGTSAILILYPGNTPPWDIAERKYTEHCMAGSG